MTERDNGRTREERAPPDVVRGDAGKGVRRDSGADSLDEPHRYLANYNHYYPRDSEAENYFRLTRGIVMAARRWRKLADKRIRVIGQSMARWETLFLVAFSDEDRNQREFAELISIEGPTLVRMLHLLEQEGLIDRRQSETDRRMTTNSITPAGRAAVNDIKAITDTLRIELLRDIDPTEIEICQRVLTKIIGRLKDLE